MRYFFLGISLAFVCCSSTEIPTPTTDNNKRIPTTELDEPVFQAKMLNLVNNLRAKGCTCGKTVKKPATSVLLNDALSLSANRHAKDMNETKFFSHTGSDGSNFSQRAKLSNYKGFSMGENIALGYPTPESVISGWIKSEGHCNNMMNPSSNEMGVAKVGNYWVQVFGQR
jgi:uncharacterized protein YkwD